MIFFSLSDCGLCPLCRYLHLIAFSNLQNILEKKFWEETVGELLYILLITFSLHLCHLSDIQFY